MALLRRVSRSCGYDTISTLTITKAITTKVKMIAGPRIADTHLPFLSQHQSIDRGRRCQSVTERRIRHASPMFSTPKN